MWCYILVSAGVYVLSYMCVCVCGYTFECEATPINTVMAHDNFNHSMFTAKLITSESKCPFYSGQQIYFKLVYWNSTPSMLYFCVK